MIKLSVDYSEVGRRIKKRRAILGYTQQELAELAGISKNHVSNIENAHTILMGDRSDIYSIAKTEREAKAENRYHKNVNYHGMGEQEVGSLYEKILDPVMVIAAKDVNGKASPMRSTHSVVAIVDIGSKDKHLLMPVEIAATRNMDGNLYDVNVLSSAYERNVESLVQEAIAQQNIGDTGIYYIKKEAPDILMKARVQFPKQFQNAVASDGIIARFPQKVNMQIKDATQSLQFKRWFGDWQNEPEKASKVVDEDGKPLAVYHGTDGDFNEFRRDGGAYFFSEGRDYAESMAEERNGSRVIEAYLDMKKPYEVKMPREKFADPAAEAPYIRYAKEHGYDGVIFENDTDRNDLAYDRFYAVFSPEQIKSATDNVGTFDRKNPDIRYSIEEMEDGEKYVKLDGDIFTGDNGEQLTETEAYNRLIGKTIRLPDGDIVTFVKYLPGGKRMNRELFRRNPSFNPYDRGIENMRDLNTAINRNIEEIISVSDALRKGEPDVNGRHAKNTIIGFDTRKTIIADEKNAYDLTLSVAQLSNGKKIAYAKKFVKTNKTAWAKIKKKNGAGVNSPNHRTSSKDSIHTSTPKSQEKFFKTAMEIAMEKAEQKKAEKETVKLSLEEMGEEDIRKTIEELVQTFGAIERGEAPENDVRIPKRVDKDTKVRRGVLWESFRYFLYRDFGLYTDISYSPAVDPQTAKAGQKRLDGNLLPRIHARGLHAE